MREIADAGNIKAKVTIEYDGGGIEKAKEDLKSLTEAAGGVGQGAAQAGEELGNLDEKAGGAREGLQALTAETRPLSEGLADVEKSGGGANDVLAEQTSVVDELKASHEAAQETIAATNQAFEEGGTSAVDFSRNVEAMNKSFDASAVGLSDFYENMSVMQDALVNPEPFNMIQQHLSETGQSWSDFVSSVGPENETILRSMADNAGFLQQYTQAIGEEFLPGNAVERAQAYTDQFLAMSDATKGATGAVDEFAKAVDPLINAQGGVGALMYGPAEYQLTDMINKNGGVGSKVYGPEPFATPEEPLFSSFGEMLAPLNELMMPMFALQMIGMAVGQVATGIYNMAAIAEGPAAHGVGTFTGSVDALGQSLQQAGQQFSEGFGQSLIPTLDAANNVTSQQGGLGSLGKTVGDIAATAANVGQIIGGMLTLTTGPIGGAIGGGQMLVSGTQGLINQGAAALGLPLPFQGPAATDPTTAALEQQTAALEQQIDNPAYPAYLAAQAKASSMQAKAVEAQRAFDTSHFSGATDLASDNYIGGQLLSGYVPSASNMSDLAQNYRFFMDQPYGSPYGGCFVAGTRILLANGGERAIETLEIGEQVRAHDGVKQITVAVIDRLIFVAKQTYELFFDDGNTVTTTDSHPFATIEGWRSLSPDSTRVENPELDVLPLQIGDYIYTADEQTCVLVAIEKRDIVRVYNITVDGPHTYYANGLLVHNAKLSQPAPIGGDSAGSNGEITKTIPVSVNWNISGELEKTWQSVSSWNLSGELQKIWQSVSGWNLSGELEKVWQSVSGWNLSGELEKVWQSMSSWNLSGELEKVWQSMSSWNLSGELEKLWNASSTWDISGELTHTFEGAADWVGKGLDHLFTGEASWEGKDLVHEFEATAQWTATGLNPTFNVAPLFAGLPGFAGGVEGYSGGPALVGEGGSPEVIASNGQYTMVGSPTLVDLPAGASVYTMQNMSSLASISPLSGISAGGMSQGISLGGGDGGTVTINLSHTTTLDGRVIAQQTIPYVAPLMRLAAGVRQ